MFTIADLIFEIFSDLFNFVSKKYKQKRIKNKNKKNLIKNKKADT